MNFPVVPQLKGNFMLNILLADDHDVVRRGLKDMLNAYDGWQVCGEASNGREAVSLARKLKPDVVILDMKLPDMSGLMVLKVAKKESPATKVIAVTGYIDQAMFDQAEELGRDSFLQKPFDLERLKSEVDRLLIPH